MMKRLAVLCAAFTLVVMTAAVRAQTCTDVEVAQLRAENVRLGTALEQSRKSCVAGAQNAQAQPAGQSSQTAATGGRGAPPNAARAEAASSNIGTLLAVAVPAALVLGGVLAWFMVIAPQRRRRQLIQAQQLIEGDNPETFAQAEALLVQALTTGLKPEDVVEARFLLAYVRARLERYGDAEASLADMSAAGPLSREAAYLKLWLLARRRKHDQLEAFFNAHVDLLNGCLDAARIASITFLHLGRKNLALRSIPLALDYFDRVRKLGVLADQVPADLADHQLIFGLNAATEKNWDEARRCFTAAAESAGKDSPQARLGVLLCDWCEDPKCDIDGRLGDLLPAIEASQKQSAKSVQPGDGDADSAGNQKEIDDDVLLHGECRLWHLLSLLRTWKMRDAGDALNPNDRTALADRIAAAKAADPGMAEPWLVEGLIAYYFDGDDPERRQEAVRCLEEAVKREMSAADVLALIEYEREQAKQLEKGQDTYLKLLRAYLSDKDVPDDIRREVHDHLARFKRFSELSEIEIAAGEYDTKPSVGELQSRVEIVRKRIGEIVGPRLERSGDLTAKAELDTLSRDIKETTHLLREKAAHLEQVEGRITVYAGEILLAEEEPPQEEEK